MRVLIKLGGALLQDPESRTSIAAQLARVVRNHELVIVHGGGKQVTEFLEKQGIASRFLNGLRVSDEAVIDAVTSVIAGNVNKAVVAALLGAGIPALGLSGIDGQLTTAVELNPELGFVGKPVSTNAALLETLQAAGYVPVVACVAVDDNGMIFNVNADEMAVSCATAFCAERLIFLTDVPGVKDSSGQVLPDITASGALELIRSGWAKGGMRAKLEAATAALELGIAEISIAPGLEPDTCVRLLSGEKLGTRLIS